MATSYTSLLGLALPTTGELSGTWGDTVNNYLTTYVDTAVAGQLAISLTGDLSLSKTTGTALGSTSSQYAILNVTPSASTWTITVPAASKTYYINNLSSTYTFAFKASGGTAITVAAAEKCVVAYNGTDFVRVSSTSIFGSPSTAMTLDTSGMLGIGVTPSAWNQSGYKALEIGVIGNGINSGLNDISVFANVYYNTTLKYATSGYAASYYVQNSGAHKWFNAPSGTAGNTITFTQAMTLDASGNLGIGTTSVTNGAGWDKLVQIYATNYPVLSLKNSYRQWDTTVYGSSGALVFYDATAAAERMRLNSSGNLGLGVTPSAWGSTQKVLQIGADCTLFYNNTNDFIMGLNYYTNASNANVFIANGIASAYRQNSGIHAWYYTNSGTAGGTPTFTQAMTLDASGNLGIGNLTILAPLSLPDTIGTAGSINRIQLYQSGGVTNYGFGISSAQLNYMSGDNHVFYKKSGGTSTEYMRLDASGNLGLGVTPSAATLKTFQSDYGIYSGNLNINAVANAVYNSNWKYIGTGFATQYQQDAGKHAWLTAPSGTAGNAITFTQAMTLDASGNLLLNTTTLTSAGISTSGTFQVNTECMSRGATGGWFWENRSGGVTSSTNWYGWYTPSGSLTYLWTGSSSIASINNSTGAYTALSDRNKKKDFEPSEIGLNEVMRLKPILFRMLDDADDLAKKLGFIAQDVADVIPQAYVEHRALDAVGKESVYIGLDDRPIIAALTKAIQEQQALIQSLTDRIIQLEAK